jgi:simple sugar transport system substrate-binding protein
MKKRIGVFLLALCFVLVTILSVTAAGGREGGAQQRTVVIVNVPKLVGGAWFNLVRDGHEIYARANPHVDFFQQGHITADIAMQIREIENIIQQRPDIITVIPNSPESLEPVLARAMREGITVIAHESEGIVNAHYTVEAFDNYAYGAYLMDRLAERIGATGDYIMMVGMLTATSHNQWMRGALRRQLEAYPNMRHVSEAFFESGNNQRMAQDRTAEVLRAFPNLRGIIAGAATDVPGVALAIEEANMIGRVHLIANGVPNVNRAHLVSGAVSNLSCWNPRDVGYVMSKVGEIVNNGGRVTTGMDLGRKGYENVRVVGNVVFGTAWQSYIPGVTPEDEWF